MGGRSPTARTAASDFSGDATVEEQVRFGAPLLIECPRLLLLGCSSNPVACGWLVHTPAAPCRTCSTECLRT